MQNENEFAATDPVWVEAVRMPQPAPLEKDAVADVCVVGAGIAGMTTAYLLSLEWQRVVVLDDGPIAGGQTAATTAHLSSAIDDGFVEIERLHGEEGARLAAHSHASAIDRIEAIVAAEEIKCDFHRVDGYLFNSSGAWDDLDDLLARELEAARRTGVLEVDRVLRAPLPAFETGPCLRFGRQGQFHPLKYLAALAGAIRRNGGRICTRTHATLIEGGETARVETEQGPVVTARHVVICTNTPVNDLIAIHTKQAPYISYVVAAPVPAGAVPRALYWDTLDPYHYIRLQSVPRQRGRGPAKQELLIVGGEDHKTGQADDGAERFRRLEAWARERFPMMEAVTHRWSGQVMEPADGLAFIGRNPLDAKNVYIATGDSGMGMTHGTIAGILLTDLILERENPWTRLYDPSRRTLRALGKFSRENVNVARQYADWLTPGEVRCGDEVPPGQGAIMRHGLSKVALYRTPEGDLKELSATCPHLGCIVHWNGTEHTWNCPCHGSRFSAEGQVLNGPANSNLERVHVETEAYAEAMHE